MTCDQTQNVSLLIDGELPLSERHAVEQHLLECAECTRAREEFLSFRTQIASYSPSLAQSASDLALAKVLSAKAPRKTAARPAATPAWPARTPAWRNPLAGLFETPRLAAIATLIAVAFTIGAITFLNSRSPENVANNTASTREVSPTRVDGPANADAPKSDEPTDLSEATAQIKKGTKRSGRGKPTQNRRLKPEGERTAPVQPPRPQVGVPPTYAMAEDTSEPLRLAGAEMLTARHLEQSELLLRSFRNARPSEPGSAPAIAYERRRARQLLYQNIRLRREADDTGDVEVASLLSSLEPILLDIANLRNEPDKEEITAIRERVERKSLVALLQINSTMVARAND